MKSLNLILTLTVSLSTFSAFAADTAIECANIETPTSTNDSWGLYILNNKIAFWDNNSMSKGVYLKTVNTQGGSTYLVFKGQSDFGDYKVNIDQIDQSNGYAELFLGSSRRPVIFECKTTTAKEIEFAFED